MGQATKKKNGDGAHENIQYKGKSPIPRSKFLLKKFFFTQDLDMPDMDLWHVM